MKDHLDRIERLEKLFQKIINPEDTQEYSVVVNRGIGETEEQKISELEKKVGHKIKKNKILLVNIYGLTRRWPQDLK